MSRSNIRCQIASRRGQLEAALERVQFVGPHSPVGQAAESAAVDAGYSAAACSAAVAALEIDPKLAVGRLRRTELAQLARRIERTSRCATTAAAMSQPMAPAV